ncbi:HNH endonuclease family protein [Plantactinospora sp. KLBMP9567]|uniref:HNH endonuclease family protein n=1 Tax=Plantactinospora sp. KLBMP9567 TaxID=3085900 RepID=UPI002981A61A|nr:HNH endonuclease family protein [Plantactinospora sp. KLBMP9567]MDW5324742.1 HNH endonuclease family protein [Plantactinospora sp. KLBMP9567]
MPHIRRRRIRLTLTATAAIAAIAASLLVASPVGATPPGIPSKATAQSNLNALTVAAQGSMTGYSRDLFPHWITISGACNTRETVLRRDGSGVGVDSSCYPTSGSWYSPYDGATWTNPADVDIDHIVPLAEAWRSGANSWTTSRRQSFANDRGGPQLIAVTDNVNQAKGDQDPSTWKPSRTAYHCTYAKMWIRTKYNWGLRLQSAEKSALQTMLNTCSS